MDHAKAFGWYLKSAEQGLCKAQNIVGSSYLHGKGCEKDESKAVVWFKKAARQGHQEAKDALERMGIKFY